MLSKDIIRDCRLDLNNFCSEMVNWIMIPISSDPYLRRLRTYRIIRCRNQNPPKCEQLSCSEMNIVLALVNQRLMMPYLSAHYQAKLPKRSKRIMLNERKVPRYDHQYDKNIYPLNQSTTYLTNIFTMG